MKYININLKRILKVFIVVAVIVTSAHLKTLADTITNDDSGSKTAETTPENSSSPETAAEEPVVTLDSQQIIQAYASATQVSNWDELKAAISNTSVTEIVFTGNISRTTNATTDDLPTINRSLVIDGAGFTLNMVPSSGTANRKAASFVLGTTTAALDFKLRNITIKKNWIDDSGAVIQTQTTDATSGNWTVHLHNVSNIHESTSSSALMNIFNSSVIMTGTIKWQISNTDYYDGVWPNRALMRAAHVTITDGAQVDLKAYGQVVKVMPYEYNVNTASSLTINQGSVVNIYSTTSNAIMANRDYTTNAFRAVIDGAGTVLNATTGTGSNYGYNYNTSALSFLGMNYSNVESERSGVFLTNGAVINAEGQANASGQSRRALLVQIERYNSSYRGGIFKIDGDGTQLNAKANGDPDAYAGVLHMRYTGYQDLIISNNAVVDVQKTGGYYNSEAVRIYGNDNIFTIESGGQMKVYNSGQTTGSTARDPGGDSRLAGIHFRDGTGQPSTFTITGENSSLAVTADYGPAIDFDNSSGGTFNFTDKASFQAEGRTSSATSAVISGNNALTFYANDAMFYDIRNNRPGGGSIVASLTASSTFESIDMDVAFWKKGANLDGNSYRDWVMVTYKLQGTAFNFVSSDDGTFNTSANSFGSSGLSAYSRMTGNNAAPVVDELYVIQNTDKYLYGHVSVPEGVELDLRNAHTDEVQVKIKETLTDGTINYYQVTTTGMSNDDPGISVYGETPRGGIFVLPLGAFALPGTTYEVVSAWRGEVSESSTNRHVSEAKDILTAVNTVVDKTPPLPAAITTPDLYENKKELAGTWSYDGVHNADAPVKVYASLNGTVITDGGTPVLGTIKSDGTWTYSIPTNVTLSAGDIVQVILEDGNGNANPLTDTVYRDASFTKATPITVQAVILELTANDCIIGLDTAKTILTDDDLIALADAKGYDYSIPGSTPVVVVSSNFQQAAGTYTIVFGIESDPTFTETITITVLPRDIIVQGDQYVIGANNIKINSVTANGITNQQLITLAQAKGWLISDLSDAGVSVLSHNVQTAEGVYEAVFYVVNEPATIITVNVTVDNGSAPVISATTPVVINVGASFNYLSGVTAFDDEDGDITSQITYSGSVDVNKEGVYKVIYSVTDADYNTSTKIVSVVVKGDHIELDDNYAVYAENFVISGSDVVGTDAQILAQAQAKAWDLVTGEEVNAVVADNGGYSATEGTYAIQIQAEGYTGVTRSIQGVVYDGTVGCTENYCIAAHDIQINTTVAGAITNQQLIALTGAEGWLRKDMSSTAVEVVSHNVVGTAGTYQVTFAVSAHPDTKVTVNVIVTDGSAPELSVSTPIELEVGEQFNYMDGVSAVDAEDGIITDRVTYTGYVDVNTAGLYVLTYSVTDSSSNTVNAKRTVVVNDGTFVVDIDYIMRAIDFSTDRDNVKGTYSEIIALSQAQAWDSKTGEEVAVQVMDNGGYKAEKGVYTIKIAVALKPAVIRTIHGTVTSDELPYTGVSNTLPMVGGITITTGVFILIIAAYKRRKEEEETSITD